MERRTYFKLSAEQNYKTLNTFELIISAKFEICCSVGRVAADGVWLLFGVMWCGMTAVSDGYGDRTV